MRVVDDPHRAWRAHKPPSGQGSSRWVRPCWRRATRFGTVIPSPAVRHSYVHIATHDSVRRSVRSTSTSLHPRDNARDPRLLARGGLARSRSRALAEPDRLEHQDLHHVRDDDGPLVVATRHPRPQARGGHLHRGGNATRTGHMGATLDWASAPLSTGDARRGQPCRARFSRVGRRTPDDFGDDVRRSRVVRRGRLTACFGGRNHSRPSCRQGSPPPIVKPRSAPRASPRGRRLAVGGLARPRSAAMRRSRRHAVLVGRQPSASGLDVHAGPLPCAQIANDRAHTARRVAAGPRQAHPGASWHRLERQRALGHHHRRTRHRRQPPRPLKAGELNHHRHRPTDQPFPPPTSVLPVPRRRRGQ
jgi:hypothetical protein